MSDQSIFKFLFRAGDQRSSGQTEEQREKRDEKHLQASNTNLDSPDLAECTAEEKIGAQLHPE